MEFKEPKVEIIKLNAKEVIFASSGSGVEYCTGGNNNVTTCPDSHID